MTHIEPENIRSRADQSAQRLARFRRRPERADDFRSTHALEV